jgi:ABC-type transport system involved in Fe-S cluster assembly fused permease/ATPase subunit
MESPAKLVEVLHYVAPPATVISYFVTVACLTPSATTPPTSYGWIRKVALIALPVLCSTYIAESFVYVARAVIEKNWWASQDTVLYLLFSIIVWGGSAIYLHENPKTHLYVYKTVYTAGLVIEGALLGGSSAIIAWNNVYCILALAIQISRVSLFVGLAGHVWYISLRELLHKNHVSVEDPEGSQTEPLLQPTASSNGSTYGTLTSGSDAVKKDEDDEEEDPRAKAQREHKRKIEEAGGLWNYLKGFGIFVPHLIPHKERSVQIYLALIGLCITATRVFNVLVPRQLGIIVNKLTEMQGTGQVPWKDMAIWVIFRLVSHQSTLHFFQSYCETKVDVWSSKNINEFVFSHVMNLSMDFHDSKDSGEVVRAVQQGSALSKLFRRILFEASPFIIDMTVALIYITHLFDIYCAAIVVVACLLYILITWKGTKWEADCRRDWAKSDRKLTKTQYESVTQWTTISHFNRFRYQHSRLVDTLSSFLRVKVGWVVAHYSIEAARNLVLFVGKVSVCFLAAYYIARGQKPVGSFVTLVTYWATIEWPLMMFSYLSNETTRLLVEAERVLEILKAKPSVADNNVARPLYIEKGEISFKDVSFSYDKSAASAIAESENDADKKDENIESSHNDPQNQTDASSTPSKTPKRTLSNITITCPAGTKTALVGSTGSGKSTLLKLLFRFYDPQSGLITIDGNDVRDVTIASLRENLGMVPQAPSLFNGTIAENLRFAKLDATQAEMEEACEAACIHDKIMTWPKGYETKVGERGVKLSGGEAQRLAIARLFLKKPRIVLLDEATSAVDSKTEAGIQDAFKRLCEGRTTLVIAHRLSTIRDADQVVVLEDGEIKEVGKHEELLRKPGGAYRGLWEVQIGGLGLEDLVLGAQNISKAGLLVDV